jgi:hypothetical protein
LLPARKLGGVLEVLLKLRQRSRCELLQLRLLRHLRRVMELEDRFHVPCRLVDGVGPLEHPPGLLLHLLELRLVDFVHLAGHFNAGRLGGLLELAARLRVPVHHHLGQPLDLLALGPLLHEVAQGDLVQVVVGGELNELLVEVGVGLPGGLAPPRGLGVPCGAGLRAGLCRLTRRRPVRRGVRRRRRHRHTLEHQRRDEHRCGLPHGFGHS